MKNFYRYLAIDPGVTTGYAILDKLSTGDFVWGDIGTTNKSFGLSALIATADVVLCEDYIIRMPSASRIPLNVLQDVKGACQFFGKTLILQQPATKEIPKALCNKYEVIPKGFTQHSKDAIYHILFHIIWKEKLASINEIPRLGHSLIH